MKTLDRKAAEIFRALLALQTTKIDNSDGTYMPVYLELIGRIDKYDFFSLAHYGQQNGDAKMCIRDSRSACPPFRSVLRSAPSRVP